METGERDVLWQRMDAPGLEHLRLMATPDGFTADGMLLEIEDGQPFRASYAIRCDAAWRVQKAFIMLWNDPARSLLVQMDSEGRLFARQGGQSHEPMPLLDGCRDVDIYPSPFTNTLPIRRLQLPPGHSAEIAVAFIKLPELIVQPARQRYTCLEAGPEGARYRYEGLESGFTTELRVDADGLVLDYPGFFRRVWP